MSTKPVRKFVIHLEPQIYEPLLTAAHEMTLEKGRRVPMTHVVRVALAKHLGLTYEPSVPWTTETATNITDGIAATVQHGGRS